MAGSLVRNQITGLFYRFTYMRSQPDVSPDPYPIPAARVQVEQEARRSIFITTLEHAPDRDAAYAFITRVRFQYDDASHNCWAFVAGPPGSTAQIGCSDDGEPASTAGRPMLKVLLHSGIGEIASVTTRYYGGINLGRGGLVRAYTSGVQAALIHLETDLKITLTHLHIALPYTLLVPCQNSLSQFKAQVENTTFGVQVQMTLALPSHHYPAFKQWFMNLTRGQGHIEILETT